MTAHFHEQGSVLQGTKEGFCDGFEIEFSVESDGAPEKIADLIRLAHRMCFTESALSGPIRLTKKHFLNGQEIEVEER